MEGTLVQFGNIFRHKEKEYVFLAQTDEVIYAALILDCDQTKRLKNMSDRIEPKHSLRKDNPIYSFVILTTGDFKDRAVNFARTDDGNHQRMPKLEIIDSLNKEDLLKIRNEIVSKNSVVPLRLKELVNQLNIS